MEKLSNGIKVDIRPVKKVDKFTERQNWLTPKRRKFRSDAFYQLRHDECQYPIFGKLINEYRNTACFGIMEFRSEDKPLLKSIGYRMIVKKKDVSEVCTM